MIELYHCVGARSFRPLWTLEELGLAYELRVLPFPPRIRAPDYLDANPLGTVPLFLDGETRMTESAAICHYLVDRYGPTPLAVTSGEPDYGSYLNWLSFGEATLTFPQTIVLRYAWLEEPGRRLPQAAEDYGRWFGARLRAVDRAAQNREWLCAGRFTVADISVGYALHLADQIGLSGRFSPAVRGYWKRIRAREAFHRAMDVELRGATKAGITDTALLPAA